MREIMTTPRLLISLTRLMLDQDLQRKMWDRETNKVQGKRFTNLGKKSEDGESAQAHPEALPAKDCGRSWCDRCSWFLDWEWDCWRGAAGDDPEPEHESCEGSVPAGHVAHQGAQGLPDLPWGSQGAPAPSSQPVTFLNYCNLFLKIFFRFSQLENEYFCEITCFPWVCKSE